MNELLIRVLSTGRTGTKFVAAAFSNQGYLAFHENLYEGEPGSAIIHYTRMLGDMWLHDRQKYYLFESDFAKPYIEAVLGSIQPGDSIDSTKGLMRWKNRVLGNRKEKAKERVLIHTGHRLTSATPLIEREAEKNNLFVRTLILYRNPLKTIHALYKVENASNGDLGPYRNRPSSFFRDNTYLGAAQIWANTYQMIQDQSDHCKNGPFLLINLDRFDNDIQYTKSLFKVLELTFNEETFNAFVDQTLGQPLRGSKVDSVRNSHIFHDPEFCFTEKEIQQIYPIVQDLLDYYGLDWDQTVNEYLDFHEREKVNKLEVK